MSEVSQKVSDAIEFLTPDEVVGVLQGTLEGIERENPGYTDHLILGVLSIRAGLNPGNPYEPGEVEEN